jgi:hypothetical protein
MAKDCPKCGAISSDEVQRCDCGYNYATGMLRRETNEVDRGFGRIEGGQTYKFGWFVAWSGFHGQGQRAPSRAPRITSQVARADDPADAPAASRPGIGQDRSPGWREGDQR